MEFKVSNPPSGFNIYMDQEACDFMLTIGKRFRISGIMVGDIPMIDLSSDEYLGKQISEQVIGSGKWRIQDQSKGDKLPTFGAAKATHSFNPDGVSLVLPELKKIKPPKNYAGRKMPLRMSKVAAKSIIGDVTKSGIFSPENIDYEEHHSVMTEEQKETFKKLMSKMNRLLALPEFYNLAVESHPATSSRPAYLSAKITITKVVDL